jgi:3-dehydroquinate dehydratase-1
MNPQPTAPSIGPLPIGRVPWIVGTVSDPDDLARLASGSDPHCDIVELRLDCLGLRTPGWERAGRRLAGRVPVIVTLRHEAEGGKWTGPEEGRLQVLEQVLPWAQAVDTEIRQKGLAATVRRARSRETTVIGSFHDFRHTPGEAELRDLLRLAEREGADVAKFAVRIKQAQDVEQLGTVLGWPGRVPRCLLGIGPMGSEARIALAARGSCLTYGYIGRSAAAGQLPVAELREKLAACCPAYREALRKS